MERTLFTIEVAELATVHADTFTRSPAGEAAKIVTEGVTLEAGLAEAMPLTTDLKPLTSVGNRHTYALSVRGWTVAQFVTIATAYANGDFATAARLTRELRPPRGDED